jgi:hypothetical protein
VDEIGFAVGETHVNPRVAEVERKQNAVGYGPVGVQSSEWASEVFYNIHVKEWLDLRPNIQCIASPGGVSHTTNDLIVGLIGDQPLKRLRLIPRYRRYHRLIESQGTSWRNRNHGNRLFSPGGSP